MTSKLHKEKEKKVRIIEIVNNGPFAELSNFCASSCLDMDPFRTIIHGHYFCMARLAGCSYSVQNAVLRCKTTYGIIDILGPEVYKYCSSIPHFNARFKYDKVYENVLGLISLKVANNSRCKRLLLSTGDAELHMMNGTDNVLGMGRTGRRGLNISGVALMELRRAYSMILLAEKIIKPMTLNVLDDYVCEVSGCPESCIMDAVHLGVNEDLDLGLGEEDLDLITCSEDTLLDLDFDLDVDVAFRMTPLSCMGGASSSMDDVQTPHQSTPVHPDES